MLEKYFPEPRSRAIVIEHSRLVAAKALAIARSLDEPLDLPFIEQAALLHDIGICRTSAPGIGCHGCDHYLCHGIHGREILEREGFTRHAMVCERHIGVGLTARDIASLGLPLPIRDMKPIGIEEEVISFADLFYSKKPASLAVEKTVAEVRADLVRHGDEKLVIFDQWLARFGNPAIAS